MFAENERLLGRRLPQATLWRAPAAEELPTFFARISRRHHGPPGGDLVQWQATGELPCNVE